MISGKIAYIMSRFPNLTETFILREMIEIERLGWKIDLYPLILQKQTVVHPEAKPFLLHTHDTPILSISTLRENLRAFFKHPLQYLSLGVQVVWENRTSPKFLLRALVVFPKSVQMASLMKQDGVSHIHAHFATHPALAAWIIHKLTNIPYSVTIHAHDIFVEKAMLAKKLKDAAFIVAISNYNRKYLADQFGDWVNLKTHVIHCGVLPEDFSPSSQPSSSDHLEIISIGSLQPYKGQKYLVEACASLHHSGISFKCKIIGGGELQSALSAQIIELGLAGIVELTGPLTQGNVAQELSRATCYIQPSVITATGKMEGIPVSLMEAMACSVPVIATSISGVPELVQDQSTGILVPPEDVISLVNAIISIYNDKENARRIARNGRELVLEQFNLHNTVKQLSILFQNSLQS